MKKENKWKGSKYQGFIRITKENLGWLKKTKGNKSIARHLEEIIDGYKNKQRIN